MVERYRKIIMSLIERIESKIQNNSNIKKDMFYLEEIYNFLLKEDPSRKKEISIIEEVLPKFKSYLNDFYKRIDYEKEQRKREQLKLEKINEYTVIWEQRGRLFHLIHRNINPLKIKTEDINIETIENNIQKVKRKKM